MTDTVTRLMAKVHAIENLAALAADPMNSDADQTEYVHDLVEARQALEAELTRLFTPLSQSEVVDGFCKQPHDVQFVSVFNAGVRFAEKHRGIGGES